MATSPLITSWSGTSSPAESRIFEPLRGRLLDASERNRTRVDAGNAAAPHCPLTGGWGRKTRAPAQRRRQQRSLATGHRHDGAGGSPRPLKTHSLGFTSQRDRSCLESWRQSYPPSATIRGSQPEPERAVADHRGPCPARAVPAAPPSLTSAPAGQDGSGARHARWGHPRGRRQSFGAADARSGAGESHANRRRPRSPPPPGAGGKYRIGTGFGIATTAAGRAPEKVVRCEL
jgi:hypothetical protein